MPKSSLRSLVRAFAGGASLLAVAGAAQAQPFNYGGLTGWNVDRFAPDSYQVNQTFQGRNDVLVINIGPNGYADNRGGAFSSQFYSTQGFQVATGLPGGKGFAEIDLWMPAAWNTTATAFQDGSQQNNFVGTFITAGLWGNISPAGGVMPQNGFPIERFRNGAVSPGVYGFDDILGTNLGPGTNITYNGWNRLRIEYRDTTYAYLLNGVLFATHATDPGSQIAGGPNNSLAQLFLNITSNNTNPNSFYWSNLKYGTLAEFGDNKTLTANLNGNTETESGGSTTVNPGVTVSGTSLVKATGTLLNNGTLTGLVANAGTATNGATGILNGGLDNGGLFTNTAGGAIFGGVLNLGTLSNAGSISGGISNAGTVNLNAGGNLNAGPIANNAPGILNVNGATTGIGAVTQAAGASTNVNANATFASFAGAGSLALTGASVLTTGGNNASTSFTGTTSGNGGITKVGTGTFSTGSLANTGTNTVNGGNLNTNGNVAGSVVVNSGGTFSGNANIAGNLTVNPGGILSPGNSPGTVNVAGNYAGGGSITVEVQFNNAAAPVNGTTHDFLNITGNVTGTTTLNILAVAPSTAPAATVGNGVELVRVGGTTAPGAFVLSGPVVQAGYQYVLTYLANYSGTTDGYFLQGGARQELVAISGANMASAALAGSCGSVDSRIAAAKNSRREGWVTGETGNLETGADSGLVSDGDSTCVNTGMTFASGLPGVNMGFSVGFGSYEGDLSPIGGASTLEGSRFGAEAIVSYAKDMFFVTAAAGFASQDFEFKGPLFSNSGGASGMTANVAAGVNVPVAGIADLTLAGVFDYNDAVCKDGCFGFASYQEGDAIMTGTIKAMAKASFGPFSPYAGLSYSTVFSGEGETVLGASTASFIGDGLVSGSLGVNFKVSSAANLFVEGRYKESMDVDATGQSVAAGIRASW